MISPLPGDRKVPTPAPDLDVRTLRAEFTQSSRDLGDLRRRVERIELILANLAREDDANEDRPEAAMDTDH